MTVQALIEILQAFERPDHIVDVRIEEGAMGDWRVVDASSLDDAREPGFGWVTLHLDETHA